MLSGCYRRATKTGRKNQSKVTSYIFEDTSHEGRSNASRTPEYNLTPVKRQASEVLIKEQIFGKKQMHLYPIK